jgi:hypothetical protein
MSIKWMSYFEVNNFSKKEGHVMIYVEYKRECFHACTDHNSHSSIKIFNVV